MQKTGRLELTWVGKYDEKVVEPRILLEDVSKSYGDPSSENMLIHGDNLIALEALIQEYSGKVKCIFIDIILQNLIQRTVKIKKCALAV